ncbi:MAG: hypothetical protein Q7T55_04295, partial [Solirubrobacteraceae bacterium]|nr:hypothetical protein [Solirubrobacteraceae bacterium]
RVAEARERQLARQGCVNAALTERGLVEHGAIGTDASNLLDQLYAKGTISMRGAHRVLRVSRTVADLDGVDGVGRAQLSRALAMRQDLGADERDELAA